MEKKQKEKEKIGLLTVNEQNKIKSEYWEKMKEREEVEHAMSRKQEEDRRKLVEKKNNYAKVVKDIHPPKISEKKRMALLHMIEEEK